MWPWAAGLGPGWAGPGQGPSARAWAEQRASLCWQGCTTPARFGLLLRLLHLLPAVPDARRAPPGVGEGDVIADRSVLELYIPASTTTRAVRPRPAQTDLAQARPSPGPAQQPRATSNHQTNRRSGGRATRVASRVHCLCIAHIGPPLIQVPRRFA